MLLMTNVDLYGSLHKISDIVRMRIMKFEGHCSWTGNQPIHHLLFKDPEKYVQGKGATLAHVQSICKDILIFAEQHISSEVFNNRLTPSKDCQDYHLLLINRNYYRAICPMHTYKINFWHILLYKQNIAGEKSSPEKWDLLNGKNRKLL
jgi:hypothetical protein